MSFSLVGRIYVYIYIYIYSLDLIVNDNLCQHIRIFGIDANNHESTLGSGNGLVLSGGDKTLYYIILCNCVRHADQMFLSRMTFVRARGPKTIIKSLNP